VLWTGPITRFVARQTHAVGGALPVRLPGCTASKGQSRSSTALAGGCVAPASPSRHPASAGSCAARTARSGSPRRTAS